MRNRADVAEKKEQWSSNSAFLLAAIGGAVGLGNLWRFPFIAGENGGGAFVIIYMVFVVFMSVPIMTAELIMGRRGKASAIGSMRNLIKETGSHSAWSSIGWLSIIVPLIGLSYYSVVAGWSIDYILKASSNAFSGFTGTDSEHTFGQLTASPLRMLLFHTLFIVLTVVVVARGISKGIEVIAKYMMPALFIILIILAINSIVNADIARGLEFLFSPDFSKITPKIVFMAMGQAFFSLAIGVGMLITYGAYVPASVSLPRAALTIGIVDAAVALVAGIVIFPLVFSNGLDPAGGPGLIFVTLPVAFGNMFGGYVIGIMFFILLFFAAYSSALGMLEPIVSWLEEYKSYSRPGMAALAGFVCWSLGIAAVLSFNVWSDVKPLGALPLLEEKGIFDILDFTVSSLLIPANALLIAVFAGWKLSKTSMVEEIGIRSNLVLGYIRFILRYVAPIVIAMIFYTNLS
jgi:NSS family neurotransmitter:Na+ symporter